MTADDNYELKLERELFQTDAMEVPAVNCRTVGRPGSADRPWTRFRRGTHGDFWEREVALPTEAPCKPVQGVSKNVAHGGWRMLHKCRRKTRFVHRPRGIRFLL